MDVSNSEITRFCNFLCSKWLEGETLNMYALQVYALDYGPRVPNDQLTDYCATNEYIYIYMYIYLQKIVGGDANCVCSAVQVCKYLRLIFVAV